MALYAITGGVEKVNQTPGSVSDTQLPVASGSPVPVRSFVNIWPKKSLQSKIPSPNTSIAPEQRSLIGGGGGLRIKVLSVFENRAVLRHNKMNEMKMILFLVDIGVILRTKPS